MVPVKSVMIPVEKIRKVDRDTSIKVAAEQLRDFNIGSLFVTKGGEVIGILTDTDMVRRCVAGGLDPAKATVEQIMSAPVLMIDEGKTLMDANDLMAKSHVRHLGASRGGKLVGMLSVRDLVVFLTNLPRK
jgi:CBS domain-containing protein